MNITGCQESMQGDVHRRAVALQTEDLSQTKALVVLIE